MEEDIENLIEELTKVRPSMLNDEALKLFNTIMAILDERDKLIKEKENMNVRIKTKLKIAQEEYKEFTERGQHQLALVRSGKIGVLQELLEGE